LTRPFRITSILRYAEDLTKNLLYSIIMLGYF